MKKQPILRVQRRVEFNPSDPTHRRAVMAYFRRNAWSDSPIRFEHDTVNYHNLDQQVRDQLINWYSENDPEIKNSTDAAQAA